MVLTQVKAAGLVQVFDLFVFDLFVFDLFVFGLFVFDLFVFDLFVFDLFAFDQLAFGIIDAPPPPLIQEGELSISSLFSSNSRKI